MFRRTPVYLAVGAAIALSSSLALTPAVAQTKTFSKAEALQGEPAGVRQARVRDIHEDKEALPKGSTRQATSLPRISKSLARQIERTDPSEAIRVILYLNRSPHANVVGEIEKKYAAERDALRAEAKSILKEHQYLARERGQYLSHPDVAPDSLLYGPHVKEDLEIEKFLLEDIAQRDEELALAIRREAINTLSKRVKPEQDRVAARIKALGGEVEFSTIAGNSIVAVVPAGAVGKLAEDESVLQVVSDELMEGHLTVADDATKVNASNGLWTNGQDGGAYDPAIIDSGTDLDHPALNNSSSRDNWYSWYLVAAAGHPDWDDVFSEDDENGHGTHVIGIVASEGSSAYPSHLGMAHGVDKAVTLKAGFHKTNGRASMYWSDAMNLVDRALNRTDDLRPWDSFNDDVDGFNLSYGGDTASDETSFSRFWDSVIYSYPDTVVTISAGNSGPSNTDFSDPATSYNAITVANVDDKGTTSRADDVIRSSSTRGPTENSRKKPDIAAPGTFISSANHDWESQLDFVDKTGTSMAAPMVLGVGMDLMDAGVYDEKEIKALLINTAQKNEAGINFESDSDGWSTAYGWGYMNAWATYYHRNDVRQFDLHPSGSSGDYKLFVGQMRDESSSGEGRDRVTMAWNRHASFNGGAYPTTYYSLSDLDLRLYEEPSGLIVDSDATIRDNVHQVRIDSGAPFTDVVVKAYAYDSSFDHGGTTERVALATEEDFEPVDLPGAFQGFISGPSFVAPGSVATFTFYLRNDSEIASHNNDVTLVLPSGWTRLSGPSTFDAGSIDGGGGTSPSVTWQLRAPWFYSSATLKFRHSHYSYGESWGPYDWNKSLYWLVLKSVTPIP